MVAVRRWAWEHRRVPNPKPFPNRTFGVLLHPTSIAGPEPVGTLGVEAESWVDWLASTGAGVWQLLPLTYIGEEDSPYFSASAFAGNPWLIDLRELAQAGLLDGFVLPDPTQRGSKGGSNGGVVDCPVRYEAMRAWKQPLLWSAADSFLADSLHPWRHDYDTFVATSTEIWLADACHFFALKAADPTTPWWEWDEPLRRRCNGALAESAAELASEIEREQVLQFFVERQWQSLRRRANEAGISLLGDVPIYVAPDSADVWANQHQFELDPTGRQLTQAGVPPDYFSVTGQLWRNPLYRWDVMEADGFAWWISRLQRALDQADVVRIDHFRGLSAYWSVPAAAETAIGGRWVPGPGQAFIDALRRAFPDLPIVAEDLGELDDDVIELRDDNNLLGMRIIQFGFARGSSKKNMHHPDNVTEHCIFYTGTHDNSTLVGWWRSLGRRLQARVRAETGMPPRIRARRATRWLIDVVFRTRATVAIVPFQDLLGLGEEARMNTPGTTAGNWRWRMPTDCLTRRLADDLHQLAERTNRLA